MAKKEEEDLVPYYRPGTTEPDMVPRSSVEGAAAVAEGAESDGVITGDEAAPEPKKAAKKAAKKVAKKK